MSVSELRMPLRLSDMCFDRVPRAALAGPWGLADWTTDSLLPPHGCLMTQEYCNTVTKQRGCYPPLLSQTTSQTSSQT